VFWGASSPLRAGMGMVGPVRLLKRGLGRGNAASRRGKNPLVLLTIFIFPAILNSGNGELKRLF